MSFKQTFSSSTFFLLPISPSDRQQPPATTQKIHIFPSDPCWMVTNCLFLCGFSVHRTKVYKINSFVFIKNLNQQFGPYCKLIRKLFSRVIDGVNRTVVFSCSHSENICTSGFLFATRRNGALRNIGFTFHIQRLHSIVTILNVPTASLSSCQVSKLIFIFSEINESLQLH